MAGLGPGVLVTRSQPGADASAKRLAARGYRAFVSPVLKAVMHQQPEPSLEGVQALIATSAHGVAALARVPGASALPLYCLAGASLETARASGLGGAVHPVAGDAAELGGYIVKRCNPHNGPLLWARGQHIATDMQAVLAKRGLAVRTWQAYAAHPASALDEAALTALRAGAIKAVLVHSARGAQVFAALAAHHGLALQNLVFIAISARAAAPLKRLDGVQVHAAASPAEDAMIQKLDSVLRGLGA